MVREFLDDIWKPSDKDDIWTESGTINMRTEKITH